MKWLYTAPIIAGLAMAGCGNQSAETAQPKETTNENVATQTETPDTSKKTTGDVYKVATMDYEPFAYKDERGEPIGYDIDLMNAIAQEQGFQVEYEQKLFADLIPSVLNGSVDMTMSGMSLLPERQEIMLASNPYSQGIPGYFLTEDSPIYDISDVEGKKVSAVENSSLHKILTKETEEELVLKPTMFLAVQTIFTGEADTIFGMQPVLIKLSESIKDTKLRFIPYFDPVLTTVYAGKDKQDKIDVINEGFVKIKSNGKYDEITKKWFGDNASAVALK